MFSYFFTLATVLSANSLNVVEKIKILSKVIRLTNHEINDH